MIGINSINRSFASFRGVQGQTNQSESESKNGLSKNAKIGIGVGAAALAAAGIAYLAMNGKKESAEQVATEVANEVKKEAAKPSYTERTLLNARYYEGQKGSTHGVDILDKDGRIVRSKSKRAAKNGKRFVVSTAGDTVTTQVIYKDGKPTVERTKKIEKIVKDNETLYKQTKTTKKGEETKTDVIERLYDKDKKLVKHTVNGEQVAPKKTETQDVQETK